MHTKHYYSFTVFVAAAAAVAVDGDGGAIRLNDSYGTAAHSYINFSLILSNINNFTSYYQLKNKTFKTVISLRKQ